MHTQLVMNAVKLADAVRFLTVTGMDACGGRGGPVDEGGGTADNELKVQHNPSWPTRNEGAGTMP